MPIKVSCQTLAYSSASTTVYADTSVVTECSQTMASFYGASGDTDTAREVDFLWGGCACWDTPSMVGLAMGVLEDGGTGNDWLQIGTQTTPQNFYDSVVANNTTSGNPEIDLSTMNKANSVNAQVAMWLFKQKLAAEGSLRGGVNGYNGVPYTVDVESGAYGANVLWVAYGNGWASASGMDYIGQYLATGPSGDQMRLGTNGSTPVSVYEPGFSVPSQEWHSNYGTNSAGKRVLLLDNSSDLVSYVDCLLVEQWLDANGYIQAFLTGDAGVAASSASSSVEVNVDCVIAVGADAIAAIKDQGYTLTEYTGFGDWEDGSGAGNPGFIGAIGYSGTLSVVEDACSNGWS